MPSSITRAVTKMLRALCSCTKSQEACTNCAPYKQISRPNKKGVQVAERAQMLDPEDCAWM
ncbi:hypothetical protein M422DRAFT_25535 [Sphaerobolus stellatus SS14]|nr:hypothetical protein M422DRAFT_25535 [Sphaerobolus stellatus SS14]